MHRVPGTVWPIVYEFWSGLALAAACDGMPPSERAAAMAQIVAARASFERLAASCAENFRCPALLLAAEIERLEGRLRSAIELCEEAVEYAGQIGDVQHRAFASERCARLRLQCGQARLAALFMSQARECYARWGATAKVAQLEHCHPELLLTVLPVGLLLALLYALTNHARHHELTAMRAAV